jgi:hypothetical protein
MDALCSLLKGTDGEASILYGSRQKKWFSYPGSAFLTRSQFESFAGNKKSNSAYSFQTDGNIPPSFQCLPKQQRPPGTLNELTTFFAGHCQPRELK